MQLENTISLEEYKQKKAKLLNQKTALKQKLADFGRKGNCWLEPMRNFILSAHQANFLKKSENLEEKRSFLQKIGSNWTLRNKTLDFQAQKEWEIALNKSQFSVWSTFTTPLEPFSKKIFELLRFACFRTSLRLVSKTEKISNSF
jgi:hypothetical protein